ncbi:MAG: hypothetical protein VX107_15105, partial [Pseudomonadota bacterium]|nr:hypothetical protein [Pseudomonadota bacterium]
TFSAISYASRLRAHSWAFCFHASKGPRNCANHITLTVFGDGNVQLAVGEFLRRSDNTFQRSFQCKARELHEAGEQQDLAE